MRLGETIWGTALMASDVLNFVTLFKLSLSCE
jgi:hypothetical protein